MDCVRRAVWDMLYADDAYIVSRSPQGLAKMMKVIIVQLTSSRVIDKMVVDWGRALQPCRYRLFTHMSCIILYPYST